MAHHDISRRRATLVAIGCEPDVRWHSGSSGSGAFDPERSV